MNDNQNVAKKAAIVEDFERHIDTTTALLRSRMTKEIALEHINHHRRNLPPGAAKSIWLDREIIDFIAKNAQQYNLTGVRVYFAKYKIGVDPVPTQPHLRDKQTAIVAPTVQGFTNETQIDIAYFNYGRPCPPSCNEGDAGESIRTNGEEGEAEYQPEGETESES